MLVTHSISPLKCWKFVHFGSTGSRSNAHFGEATWCAGLYSSPALMPVSNNQHVMKSGMLVLGYNKDLHVVVCVVVGYVA